MELWSDAFATGKMIPVEFTCDGKNISPQLSWDKIPAATKSFALIMDDPDAPMGTWVHWVLYNIPADIDTLAKNLTKLPVGTKIGINSWEKQEYGGPCPPSGQHRYVFKLYALDQILDLSGRVDANDLQKAMKSHILAETKLIGVYERK